jgi:hypothetical protein
MYNTMADTSSANCYVFQHHYVVGVFSHFELVISSEGGIHVHAPPTLVLMQA